MGSRRLYDRAMSNPTVLRRAADETDESPAGFDFTQVVRHGRIDLGRLVTHSLPQRDDVVKVAIRP